MSSVVSKRDDRPLKKVHAFPLRIDHETSTQDSTKRYGAAAALSGLIRSLRLHQWSKNVLVLVPLLLAGLAGNAAAWTAGLVTMLALGLVASATYIINDLVDIAHDRAHPTKRFRPIASGELSPSVAVLASGAIGGAGLALGWSLSPQILVGLLTYTIITLAYSLKIKRMAQLDCLTLGALFTLRLALGIAAVGAMWSPWLLTFSMFLFTALSLAKRHVEIMQTKRLGKTKLAGRGYTTRDSFVALGMGISASIASILIFILYLANEGFRNTALQSPLMLWMFPPLLFLWIGRIWLLAGRGQLNDDPVAFAVRDPTSIGLGLMAAIVFLLATFGLPAELAAWF